MTRVIGLGQGRNLDVFSRLALPFLRSGEWQEVGVFAADAANARDSQAFQRLHEECGPPVMAEWEVVAKGLRRRADLDLLGRVEREIGPPSLRAGLLADRRLFFGRGAKYRQNYAPRFTEAQMLGVLTQTIESAERLWDVVQPDVLVGFVPVTLGEYVLLRLAEARRVPYLLLRSTKVQDYLTFHDRMIGLSRHIEDLLAVEQLSASAVETAKRWIARTRQDGAVYEGMHPTAVASRTFRPMGAVRALAGSAVEAARRRRDPELSGDIQDPGHLRWAWAAQVAQPMRAARVRRLIATSSRGLDRQDLQGQPDGTFAFFPLHFEPEVSLQLYARPWQNQIEVARLIALALPAGMRLVVKDHPRSAGMRTIDYYRKLLEIPNVVLAQTAVPSSTLVSCSELVVVVTGNVGLEASAMQKPVIALGETPLTHLPRNMVRGVADPYTLSSHIADLLGGEYRHDEAALVRYVAAHIAASVRGELYSTLLGKGDRHGFGAGDIEEQLESLREHLRQRLDDVLERLPA